MGSKGRCFCLGSCCLFPCLPLFSLNIRQRAMSINNVPGGCCEEWKACCCACSLFQIFVALEEWDLENQPAQKTTATKNQKGKNSKAPKQQGQKKPKNEDAIPLPVHQQNEMTQLVMTYMGDILGESDSDYETDEEDEEEFDVVEVPTKVNPPKQNGNYESIPSNSRDSSHMDTRIDVLQVTIPPGHFGGSIFEIENNFGEILEVEVPAGGKPGMKMQVPNKAPAQSQNTPSGPMQQDNNPIMVKEGTMQVIIPPNHYAGDMFYIQSSHGDTMEVVVPTGGQPGMKMQIPNAFTDLINRPPPPQPAAKGRTTPPPPGIVQQQKPKLPKHDSKKSKKKLKKSKSGASTRSTSPSGARVIQITIPEGCTEGSIFELHPTSGKGENIKVRVPKGGRPGMRVQIRVPSFKTASTAPPKPSPSSDKATPLRKQQPVMRESPKKKDDKITRHAYGSYGGGGKPIKPKHPTASVTVPQGVAEGEPFVALDGNTGQQVLVIMPAGVTPGEVIDAPIVHDT